MADNSCIKIEGGNHIGKTLAVGHHEECDFIFGGAFLRKCVLDIRGAAFQIIDANFLNCQIKVRRKVSNVRFLEAVFENCTFEGNFTGCRFGYRRGESKSPNAFYRNCDFSGARLDLCDFFVGDVDSIIWPSWPNFAVLNPQKNKADWLSIPLPDELKIMQSVIAGEDLAGGIDAARSQSIDMSPQAITVDLAMHKTVDPEIVWPLLQPKSYILFQGKNQKGGSPA